MAVAEASRPNQCHAHTGSFGSVPTRAFLKLSPGRAWRIRSAMKGLADQNACPGFEFDLSGAERTRTADPLPARQMLSQLSYSPVFDFLLAIPCLPGKCSPAELMPRIV